MLTAIYIPVYSSKNMKVEREAKFIIRDPNSVATELLKLGFVSTGRHDQKDTYYLHPTRPGLSFHPTYLRVRTHDGKSSTAMHHKLASFEWVEDETTVGDGDTIRQIYHNLGFDIDVEVHKIRTSFELQGIEAVLDEVIGLGSFLEIEASELEVVFEIAQKLGLSRADAEVLEGKSYADLVRERRAK